MTIEFECPQCAAAIRVADAAAGRRGSCPKCRVTLIVPHVDPPPLAAALPPAVDPILPPSPFTAAPEAFAPSPPDAWLPGSLEELGDAAVVSDSRPAVAKRLKSKRRSRSWTDAIVPVICLAAFGALGTWFYMTAQPSLTGTLQATSNPSADLPPVVIPKSLFEIPAGEVDALLEELEKRPARIDTALMRISLQFLPAGLQVDVREGTDTRFVRLDPAQNPVLVAYAREHGPEWEERRLRSFTAHLNEFLEVWSQHVRKQEVIADYLSYRNSVGLAALVQGLGFHVEAVVNLQKFPCVYQDGEGHLYFLLPPETRQFTLQGREIDNATPFPGHYTVTVGAAKKKKPPRAKPAPEKVESDAGDSETVEPATTQAVEAD